MRAKGTLAALCVLMGTALIQVPAEASERGQRTAQKQARPVAAATAPNASSQAQLRAQAAARAAATRQAATARRQGAAVESRHSLAPQQVSMSVPQNLLRPAYGNGAGTPILPVSVTSGLSCVPFARMATGMNISGDARLWWSNAAGSYARGNAPERGSVLAFTASGGMQRGHVAVVSRVVGPRTIQIDHSNWGGPGIRRGTVMRGVMVMDVSDRNDWTAVRVQVGHDSSSFGRTYPTHGFIYNRPAGTRMMTAEAPRFTEVAEYPSPHAAQHQRLAAQLLER
ncbi:CHAP domain-containing protein [Falsiroseomonas sp.]|uniref:CHAP domain-containing protein n=1 Tax=Falsiroseomonas sp. TaxID=2870721 RepID=UPI0027299AD6|nr:CHAP domain-containing protein [Falsiroseomonas sp.]